VHRSDLTHPTDTALLGMVHGQSSGWEAALSMHLNRCEPCRARAADLTERELQIEALLAELDHPIPDRAMPELTGARETAGWRRAMLAAGVATLVAVGAAAATLPASPVHRWIDQLLTRTAQRASEQRPVAGPAARVTGVAVPVGNGLVVALRHPQPAGTVEIALVDRADVAVRSRGGDVAYEIAEGRVMIDNREPAERYDIEAPIGIAQLTVLMNDRAIFRKQGDVVTPASSSSGKGRFRIPLGTGAGAR
jgi:hypothetical protein